MMAGAEGKDGALEILIAAGADANTVNAVRLNYCFLRETRLTI